MMDPACFRKYDKLCSFNRFRYEVDDITDLDALCWAIKGSADVLDRKGVGELAVCKQAGSALHKLDETRFLGSHDPMAALVVCGAHQPDFVAMAGDWRVRVGVLSDIDLNQLMFQHQANVLVARGSD